MAAFRDCTASCMSRGCNCDRPAVAKFAEQLDAVGGDAGKLSFPTLIRTEPVGDYPPGYVTRSVRSTRQWDSLITIDWSQVTIDHQRVDLPEAQKQTIVSELSRRLDEMLRRTLGG